MFRRTLLGGVCLSVVFAALPLRADDDWDHEDDRAVYTMTNAAAGNSVMIYRRGFAWRNCSCISRMRSRSMPGG